MSTLDRKIAPRIQDAIEFDYVLPPINRQQLENGIPLYWFSGGAQDVAEIDFVFPAGLWQEQKPSVAIACGGLLKNGTSRHTARQINESLEFYGANLRVSTSDDFCIISLYALRRELPALIPIVHEIITDSIFPDDELAIQKQNSIQRLMVNLRKCEFVANQRIDAVLFGETHPYGRFSKIEDIEVINREDLVHFYKTNFHAADLKIFFAGKIDEKDIELVNQFFGKLPVSKVEKSILEAVSVPKSGQKKAREINDPGGVQAAIRIGRQFPNRHHPDFPKMVILNTLFGGYFGSRLMSNIREEKGYTYGIYSSMQPKLHGGSLVIHTEVGRDVMEAAVTEIYNEMDVLCKQVAEEDEVLLVKNYLLGGLLGDLDGPFQILQRWRSLILNDLDESHFYKNVQVYKTISAEELQSLAQQYFQPEDFYEIAVI